MLDPRRQPPRPPSTRVLFADPAFFQVEYEINPHMAGNAGAVDPDRARAQWSRVVEVYRRLGYRCEVLPARPGLPDLCFVANQSFPVSTRGEPDAVVLSRMHAPQRQPEVEVLAGWYRARGWRILGADCATAFESAGDALWHPGRRLIYGGHGFRTRPEAYDERAGLFGAPVLRLELVDPRFYHLDTCLSPLDEHTALFVPAAFTDAGRAALAAAFDRLLPCPEDEAEAFLAANGHCPDGRHFIVDAGATGTMAAVRRAGFEPIGVDTSEFRKSGGSVQCLKLMLD